MAGNAVAVAAGVAPAAGAGSNDCIETRKVVQRKAVAAAGQTYFESAPSAIPMDVACLEGKSARGWKGQSKNWISQGADSGHAWLL